MKQKNMILLVIAVACGVLAAILTQSYIAAKNSEVAKMKADIRKKYGTIEAIFFVKDTPSGTELSKRELRVKAFPKAGLEGRVVDPNDYQKILGKKTLTAHKAGEPLLWMDVEGGSARNDGLSADIRQQMRAVSINASGAAAVSGMIRPNDHVDVIGSFALPDSSGKTNQQGELVTCTILQNVLVLATGKETAKTQARTSYGAQNAAGYSMVTLQVTPREAEMLVFAEQMRGRLTLTLRNRNDVSYESSLPTVDFERIRGEIEELNKIRQETNKR